VTDRGREFLYRIEGRSVGIGRGAENDITLDDPKASKAHCVVEQVGDRWKMVDLGSKNGTRVNGRTRNKAWLEHGDVIRIGAAELRFGLKGARRAVLRESHAAAAEEPPERPARYRRKSAADRLTFWGLFVLGAVAIFLIAGFVASKTTGDPYNKQLMRQARKLLAEGRWEDAITLLRTKADTSGNGYENLQKKLRELETEYPLYKKSKLEEEARTLVAKLGNKVQAYHYGRKRLTTPEDILAIVQILKTKYASTDQTADARKNYAVWFAGRVPRRATDVVGAKSKLEKDWDQAIAAAREYEKRWHFREAYERIDQFLTTREALLGASQLEKYRRLRDEQFHRIDRLARSVYYGRKQLADRLAHTKRYEDAIQVYRKVIESFGIDAYIRKAKTEIAKLEKRKVAAPPK